MALWTWMVMAWLVPAEWDPEILLRDAEALLSDGETRAAISRLEPLSSMEGVDARVWSQLGYAYGVTGHHEKSLRALARAARVPRLRANAHYNEACVLAREGRIDEALLSIDQALMAETWPYAQLRDDPDLAPLVDLPRFPSPFETDSLEVKHGGRLVSVELVLPSDFDPDRAYPVLVALGPGDGLDASIQWGLRYLWGSPAAMRQWIVAVPRTPEASWFSDSGRSLFADLVDAAAARFRVEGERLHLAGCSSGGVAAVSLALAFPDRLHSLTLLPGAPRTGEELRRVGTLQGITVTHFVGGSDQKWWLEQAARMHEVITRAGGESRLRQLPGDGHITSGLFGGELMIYLDSLRSPGSR